MTQKDLRDIAAYWGAECRCIGKGGHALKTSVAGLLQFSTMPYGLTMINSNAVEVKLLLRPISALTDEELLQIGATIGLLNVAVSRNRPGVYELAIIGQWSVAESESTDPIWFDVDKIDGLVSGGYTDDDFYQDEIIYYYPAKVFAYLQSIGVYVPGSIDEQYVELV